MSRRALALDGKIPGPPKDPDGPDVFRGRFGHMTMQRWRAEGHARAGDRVLLDGADVTDDCVEFHDGEGWVRTRSAGTRDGEVRVARGVRRCLCGSPALWHLTDRATGASGGYACGPCFAKLPFHVLMSYRSEPITDGGRGPVTQQGYPR